MAGCRIVNQGVLTALDSIESCRASFEEAGQTLISSLTSAIADMEGAAKDAFQALIDKDIKEFLMDIEKKMTYINEKIFTN